MSPGHAPMAAAPVFLVSIDEVGDLVVAPGARVVLGGSGAAVALPGLPADARVGLELIESFKGGLRWAVAGAPDAELFDGARLDLARLSGAPPPSQLAARVHCADPGSASLVLELVGGVEVGSARRLLLLAPGPGGRVRVAGRGAAQFQVPGLEHDVSLEFDADSGLVRFGCEGGVRRAGEAAEGSPELHLAIPTRGRLDLCFGAAPGRLPPFGIALMGAAR